MTRFVVMALVLSACAPGAPSGLPRQCISTISDINPVLSETAIDEAALIDGAKVEFASDNLTLTEECCSLVWARTDQFTTSAEMAEMSDPERRAHINAIEDGLDLYAVVRIKSQDSLGHEQIDAFQFDRCGNALQF